MTLSAPTAARIAGLALLALVVVAPFAELYVYPTLVTPGNATETAANISAHKGLFAAGIGAYLLSFLLDILEAWALYYLLRPVSSLPWEQLPSGSCTPSYSWWRC